MQDCSGKTGHPKAYGIKQYCISSSIYPAQAISSSSTKPIHAFIPFPFGVQRHPFPFADRSMLFYFFILNVLLCQFSFSVGLLAASGLAAGSFLLVCLFFHLSLAIPFHRHVSLLGRGLDILNRNSWQTLRTNPCFSFPHTDPPCAGK